MDKQEKQFAHKIIGDFLEDYKNGSEMSPKEKIMYKALLFGAVKMAYMLGAITKSDNTKYCKDIDKIFDAIPYQSAEVKDE